MKRLIVLICATLLMTSPNFGMITESSNQSQPWASKRHNSFASHKRAKLGSEKNFYNWARVTIKQFDLMVRLFEESEQRGAAWAHELCHTKFGNCFFGRVKKCCPMDRRWLGELRGSGKLDLFYNEIKLLEQFKIKANQHWSRFLFKEFYHKYAKYLAQDLWAWENYDEVMKYVFGESFYICSQTDIKWAKEYPNVVDHHGRPPLHTALYNKNILAVKSLLEAGAHPLARSARNDNNFLHALVKGCSTTNDEEFRDAVLQLFDPKIIRYLAHQPNERGQTPLEYARQLPDENTFAQLLVTKYLVNPNIPNFAGEYCLVRKALIATYYQEMPGTCQIEDADQVQELTEQLDALSISQTENQEGQTIGADEQFIFQLCHGEPWVNQFYTQSLCNRIEQLYDRDSLFHVLTLEEKEFLSQLIHNTALSKHLHAKIYSIYLRKDSYDSGYHTMGSIYKKIITAVFGTSVYAALERFDNFSKIDPAILEKYPNLYTIFGEPLLNVAVRSGDIELVERLVKRGANPLNFSIRPYYSNHKDNPLNANFLHVVAQRIKEGYFHHFEASCFFEKLLALFDLEVIRYLAQQRDSNGKTPLNIAQKMDAWDLQSRDEFIRILRETYGVEAEGS